MNNHELETSTDNQTCQCPTLAGSRLKIAAPEGHCERIKLHTAAFEAKTGVPVTVDCISKRNLSKEILGDARLRTRLYDGYVYTPTIMGELVLYDALHDLTPFVRESSILKWNDIFMFNREHGAVYDKKVVSIPLDGDVLSLYYRMDLFEKYGKVPPKTWEEYTELAKFFNGKVEPLPHTTSNETVTISGSCVTRVGGYSYYHAFLILSSMTQYAGTKTGALFDPKDMTPLLGEAFVKTLQFMEEQFIYGADNEFGGNYEEVNVKMMNGGRCAMTYDWGASFIEHAKAPPASVISGLLGTKNTPGSRFYLDREEQKLKPCTEDLCTCINDESGDNCINSAPYAASIGWVGSCSNFSTDAQKAACAEFFAYISSPGVSIADTIPQVEMGSSSTIANPFRNSQTNVEDWVRNGYPEESVNSYLSTIDKQLSSPNTVLDLRIPGIPGIGMALYSAVWGHLTKIKSNIDAGKQGQDLFSTEEARWKVEKTLRKQLNVVVDEYNNAMENSVNLLEIYQRNLSIFSPEVNMHYLTKIRLVGFTVAAVIMIMSIIFAIWTFWNRRINIVKASQPIFLGTICSGAFIMGSAIIPMSIDDGIATAKGCDVACMAVPWLFAIGFTTSFSALFSKTWRINIIFKEAASFRRVQVSVKDVLLPFVILLILNVTLLLIWTLVDPLRWNRVISENSLDSYGSCTSFGQAWKYLSALLVAVNFCALFLANFQAYRAHSISTEFSESNYVALAMGSMFQALAIGLPILFLVKNNPKVNYFVKVALILVVSLSILLLMFIPKVMAHREKKKQSTGSSATVLSQGQSSRSSSKGGSFQSRRGARGDMPSSSFNRHSSIMQSNLFKAMNEVAEHKRKLEDYKKKINSLGHVLQEEGVDSVSVFKKCEISLDNSDDEKQ